MMTVDVDLLQRRVAAVPRSDTDYTTNFYAHREQLMRWSRAAPLQIETATDGTVIVLRADHGFWRLYHVAPNCTSLTSALRLLPPGHYVTDLVGRSEMLNEVCAAYAGAGFAEHGRLCRMTRTSQIMVDTATSGHVAEQADPDAVPVVAAFLERLLDPLIEQLPDPDELVAAAANGRLLVVYHAATLAGILMFDRKDQLAHLRFWHVAPEAQGAGVGRALMGEFLVRCVQSRRIMLWVIGDNERSIAIYRHYGFEIDGLLDRIMTLHKGQTG